MKKYIQNKGITLVFLIITIVLAVIIIATSIFFILGNTGKLERENEQDKIESDKIQETSTDADDSILNEVAGEKDDNEISVIGKNVKYKTSLNGVELTDWKVFYTEEDRVYLILADYLPNEAVNIDGIEKSGNYGVYTTENDRKVLLNEMNKKSNWDSLLTGTINGKEIKEKSSESVWAIGTPTLSMFVKSWNKKYPNEKLYIAQTDEMRDGLKGQKAYIDKNDSTKDYVEITNTNGFRNKLYFPHTENVYGCAGYWLASPGTFEYNEEITIQGITVQPEFEQKGLIASCVTTFKGLAFRPIVCLPVSILDGVELENDEKTIESDKNQVNSDTYTQEENLKIGENIEYKTTLNGVELTDWKVFYTEEDRVYLILADYLPNEALEIDGIEKKEKYGVRPNDEDRKTLLSALARKSNWDSLLTGTINGKEIKEKSSESVWAIGTPTLSMFVKSWNKKYPNEKLYITKTEESASDGLNEYYVGMEKNATNVTKSLKGTEGFNNNLYFPHKEKVDECGGYWLSSPSPGKEVYEEGEAKGIIRVEMTFGQLNGNGYVFGDYACRPVICLPSNLFK